MSQLHGFVVKKPKDTFGCSGRNVANRWSDVILSLSVCEVIPGVLGPSLYSLVKERSEHIGLSPEKDH